MVFWNKKIIKVLLHWDDGMKSITMGKGVGQVFLKVVVYGGFQDGQWMVWLIVQLHFRLVQNGHWDICAAICRKRMTKDIEIGWLCQWTWSRWEHCSAPSSSLQRQSTVADEHILYLSFSDNRNRVSKESWRFRTIILVGCTNDNCGSINQEWNLCIEWQMIPVTWFTSNVQWIHPCWLYIYLAFMYYFRWHKKNSWFEAIWLDDSDFVIDWKPRFSSTIEICAQLLVITL